MQYENKDLKKHICTLIEQGLDACVRELTDRPVVECAHCGVKANSLRNVCAAHLKNVKSREIV